MKVLRIIPLFLVLGSIISCNTPRVCEDEIISEAYVHRYGVPLDSRDWCARGQHGQVVSVQKDGVIVTRTYDSGILHGDSTYTFPHRDTIAKREKYDQGSLVQEWSYHMGAAPLKRIDYESPIQYSITTWYESGAPQSNERFESNQLIHGQYFDFSNHLESSVEEFNGFRTVRDEYGQLISVDRIENGQMVERTTYHANRAPAASTSYVNGIIEGERRTYFPGGEPSTIENWKNNVQQGKTICFEHGEKVSEVEYVNGQRHGLERCFRNGSTLVQEKTWMYGKRHGPCYSYIGDFPRTDWYYSDRLVNKPTYDALKAKE